MGSGPTIVALTTTHVFGGDQNLRYSLSLISGVLGLPAGLAILSGLKAYGAAGGAHASHMELETWNRLKARSHS